MSGVINYKTDIFDEFVNMCEMGYTYLIWLRPFIYVLVRIDIAAQSVLRKIYKKICVNLVYPVSQDAHFDFFNNIQNNHTFHMKILFCQMLSTFCGFIYTLRVLTIR